LTDGGGDEQWTTKKLGEILPKEAVEEITKFVNNTKPEGRTAKNFLEILSKYRDHLLAREVLPEYLAYVLEHTFAEREILPDGGTPVKDSAASEKQRLQKLIELLDQALELVRREKQKLREIRAWCSRRSKRLDFKVEKYKHYKRIAKKRLKVLPDGGEPEKVIDKKWKVDLPEATITVTAPTREEAIRRILRFIEYDLRRKKGRRRVRRCFETFPDGGEPESLSETIRRLVDEWTPSETDIAWFKNLVASLKVGGVWTSPSLGVVYEKTAENELTLKSITTGFSKLDDAIIQGVKRIEKLGKLTGIEVKTEGYAEHIILLPDGGVPCGKTVWVLVSEFEGLVDEVRVFAEQGRAQKAAEELCKEYRREIDEGRVTVEIYERKVEGCGEKRWTFNLTELPDSITVAAPSREEAIKAILETIEHDYLRRKSTGVRRLTEKITGRGKWRLIETPEGHLCVDCRKFVAVRPGVPQERINEVGVCNCPKVKEATLSG
jgi:hypothetical protein